MPLPARSCGVTSSSKVTRLATATVVVPTNASEAKRSAIERFAVTLVRHGTSYDEAEAHALGLAAAGAVFVSPYNDPDVIAGQGTIVGELLEQVANVATIVPLGRGNRRLLRNWNCDHDPLDSPMPLSTSVTALNPDTGKMQWYFQSSPHDTHDWDATTLADGLAGNFEEGSVTFELVRRHVADVATVTEEEIATAMRFLAREHGVIAEGSAAVGVAGLLTGKVATTSGANVGPSVTARSPESPFEPIAPSHTTGRTRK